MAIFLLFKTQKMKIKNKKRERKEAQMIARRILKITRQDNNNGWSIREKTTGEIILIFTSVI